MRDKEERHSGVNVKVINFSELEKTAVKALQEKNPDRTVTEVSLGHWAYAETTKGMMVLNNEGVGSQHPLSEKEPLEIPVYGNYEEGEKKSMDIFPVMGYRFTDPEEIRELPYTVTPLAEFIRRFGSRLEQNFRIWDKTLTEQGVEV